MRTLIVRVGAMGDVLHALPAVTALRRQSPDAFLGWVVDPRWLPLLRCADSGTPEIPPRPLLNRCFLAKTTLWKQHGLSAATLADLRQLRHALRAENFGACVDMQGSIRSAVIGRFSGAARLVGNANPRERSARWLYTERIATPARHVVLKGCELLGNAFGRTLTPVPVELPRDPAAEQWADALLPAGSRAVLLAPTAGWGAKEWPPERFGEVALALARGGCRVLVNAAAPTDTTAQRVIVHSKGCAEQVTCSLPQLIALVRRVATVVAGDTGPLHLAAALGVPVVALFGPTDPARTGPWGVRARILRDPASVTDHRRHRLPDAGLLNLQVTQVLDAAWEMLSHE